MNARGRGAVRIVAAARASAGCDYLSDATSSSVTTVAATRRSGSLVWLAVDEVARLALSVRRDLHDIRRARHALPRAGDHRRVVRLAEGIDRRFLGDQELRIDEHGEAVREPVRLLQRRLSSLESRVGIESHHLVHEVGTRAHLIALGEHAIA